MRRLGLLAAPSFAGLLIAVVAPTAFLVRTPLRLVLIGRRRGRQQRPTFGIMRTRLAGRVALLVSRVTATGIWLLSPGP